MSVSPFRFAGGVSMDYIVWWTLFSIALTFFTVWAGLRYRRKPKRHEEL
jgi:hypothetical protein